MFLKNIFATILIFNLLFQLIEANATSCEDQFLVDSSKLKFNAKTVDLDQVVGHSSKAVDKIPVYFKQEYIGDIFILERTNITWKPKKHPGEVPQFDPREIPLYIGTGMQNIGIYVDNNPATKRLSIWSCDLFCNVMKLYQAFLENKPERPNVSFDAIDANSKMEAFIKKYVEEKMKLNSRRQDFFFHDITAHALDMLIPKSHSIAVEDYAEIFWRWYNIVKERSPESLYLFRLSIVESDNNYSLLYKLVNHIDSLTQIPVNMFYAISYARKMWNASYEPHLESFMKTQDLNAFVENQKIYKFPLISIHGQSSLSALEQDFNFLKNSDSGILKKHRPHMLNLSQALEQLKLDLQNEGKFEHYSQVHALPSFNQYLKDWDKNVKLFRQFLQQIELQFDKSKLQLSLQKE